LTSICRGWTAADFSGWAKAGTELALGALAAGPSGAVLIGCTAGPVSLNVSVDFWLRIGVFEFLARFRRGVGALKALLADSVRIDCAEGEAAKVE
jgi:hypothetical protein